MFWFWWLCLWFLHSWLNDWLVESLLQMLGLPRIPYFRACVEGIRPLCPTRWTVRGKVIRTTPRKSSVHSDVLEQYPELDCDRLAVQLLMFRQLHEFKTVQEAATILANMPAECRAMFQLVSGCCWWFQRCQQRQNAASALYDDWRRGCGPRWPSCVWIISVYFTCTTNSSTLWSFLMLPKTSWREMRAENLYLDLTVPKLSRLKW